jgi:hypothetical protein
MRIADCALPAFAGKAVRIFQHADGPGRKAGAKWYWQIHDAGAASVDRWESDREGEDLNDFHARGADQLDPITAGLLTPAGDPPKKDEIKPF